MRSVCIISLGWLGTALYKSLALNGFKVSGSYHSSPKKMLHEFKFDINSPHKHHYIDDSEIVILNLPPSKISHDDIFFNFIADSGNKKIIFISSTSVYGDQGNVNETTIPTPITSNGKRLLEVENYIQKNIAQYQIIRSAGQIGPGRHPGRTLSGRSDIAGGNAPINLVSQQDLIDIIQKSILATANQIINAVNINHPLKKDYYSNYCAEHHLPLPHFAPDTSTNQKTVSTIHQDYKITSTLN